MKLIKHMEAAFVIALGLAVTVAIVPDLPAAHAQSPQRTAYASTATSAMPTVIVAAKRMSAAEKRQSLIDETRLASNATAKRSRI